MWSNLSAQEHAYLVAQFFLEVILQADDADCAAGA